MSIRKPKGTAIRTLVWQLYKQEKCDKLFHSINIYLQKDDTLSFKQMMHYCSSVHIK